MDELYKEIEVDKNSNKFIHNRFPVRFIFLPDFERMKELYQVLTTKNDCISFDLTDLLPDDDGWLTTDDISSPIKNFVINKSEKEGSDRTLQDLRAMIEMGQERYNNGTWVPPIIKTEAITDRGVTDLLEEIENHAKDLMISNGHMNLRKRSDHARDELIEIIKSRLIQEMFNQLTQSGEFERAVESIVQGEKDPYTAADDLILPKLKLS